MKDLQLKKILLEVSNMKTKILDDGGDQKNHLFENVPDDKVKMSKEVTVTNKPKDGNPGLDYFRIISCVDGQTYIGGAGVDIRQKKENESATEWLGDQKKKYEQNKENWITACEYNADIKLLQGAASYGLDKEMTSDQKEIKRTDLLNECLSMCYNVRNNLPEGCAVLFDLKYPEGGSRPVALVFDSWLRIDYKNWYDRHIKGDDSYKVREPYVVYQNNLRYKIYAEGKFKTVDLKDITNKSEFESGMKTSVTSGGQSKYDLLPLTNKEKMNMMGDNPFYENNQLKQGEGQYICMKPDASQVNYRTSAGVNEEGTFEKIDNWIKWDTSNVVGKLLGTTLSRAPEYQSNQSIWNLWLDASVVETEQGKKYKEYVESNSSTLFKTIISIIRTEKDGQQSADRIEQVFKGNIINSSKETKNYELTKLLQPFLFDIQLYDKLPENIKKSLNETGIVHKWFKVELLYPIEDKTDTGNKTSVVFVASDTTEYCKGDQENKSKVSNSNFELESLKRAPMKNLVIGNATYNYK
jgi:hypothetical protein